MATLYQVVTLEQRPELIGAFSHLHTIGWTKFMREDPIGVKYWNALLSLFPPFQFLLLNKEGSRWPAGTRYLFIGMDKKTTCLQDGMACWNRG